MLIDLAISLVLTIISPRNSPDHFLLADMGRLSTRLASLPLSNEYNVADSVCIGLVPSYVFTLA